MKRDWELIRALLAAVEAQPDMGGRITARSLPEWAPAEVNYHLWLLIEAGLLTGRCSGQPGSADGLVCGATLLTWQGHELLAAVRSDTAWARVRRALAEKAVELSFEAIRTTAAALLN